MSATLHSLATRKQTELPLDLLERIVEKAEAFKMPRFYQRDILTLHRAWGRVLHPFGAALDNHPMVVALRNRLQTVVQTSGVFAGEITVKADDPARLLHTLQSELAAA